MTTAWALWWWVWARSAAEIVETCAEVEVVDDLDTLRHAETWNLPEVGLDTDDLGTLQSHRDTRFAQRSQPGFGVLAGRDRVHLRYDDPNSLCTRRHLRLLRAP